MHYLRLIRGEYITCTQSEGSMHYLRPIRVENRISDQSEGSIIHATNQRGECQSDESELPVNNQSGLFYRRSIGGEDEVPATNQRGEYFLRPIRWEYILYCSTCDPSEILLATNQIGVCTTSDQSERSIQYTLPVTNQR